MENVADKTIACCDCGREFDFSAGEQKFYHEKGLREPRRCQQCRRAKREQRDREENNQ